MKAYEHDTYYYGGEIINTINKAIGHKYAMDRGGKYVWSQLDNTGVILYLDLFESNNAGSLEWHCNGNYKKGITVLTNKDGDCIFDENKIISFIKNYF